ncbi:NTP transferase domain-containing protein [Desulfovibrio aminophilus]|uniref:nucleotidyltransferase family protein n=1 Tax=Desulfovibrio aminophilus TaxID=81425 RepID=UPI003390A02B
MNGCSRELPTLAAVVLAAGKSRRMGVDKLALAWRGRSLLDWVLDAALALDAVIVVGGGRELVEQRRAALGEESPQLQSVKPAEACPLQSDSLRAGIAAVPPQALGALVLLGDMPLVTPGLVLRLARAFVPGRFLVPRCHGRRGNPVVIPREWFPRVERLCGDSGAKPLLTDPNAAISYLDVDDDAVLRDVDTPSDYATLTNQPSRAEP